MKRVYSYVTISKPTRYRADEMHSSWTHIVEPPCTFLYFSVMLLLQKNDNARWYSSLLHPTQRQLLKFAAIFMRKDMEEKTLYNIQIFLLHLLYNICVFFQLKPNHLLFVCLFLPDYLFLRERKKITLC